MRQEKLWEEFESHQLNEGSSDNRIKKLRNMFITCERGLKVDYKDATREDIEDFVNRLHRNKFIRKDKKEYTGSSKQDMKKFLKQFYKWLKGESEFYPTEVRWLKTRIRKDEQPKEKPTLSIEEARTLATGFAKIEYTTLVKILFDSGFRIGEVFGEEKKGQKENVGFIRKKDLTWESYTRDDNCFWIKCRVSKTLTRKIPIPLFTEDIQSFVNSVYFKVLKDNEPLFKITRQNFTSKLKEMSKHFFGPNRIITAHALRHSSATYYSQKFDGNMNLIASRYGWSFSSKELKTYIRRSGAYEKEGVKKIYANEAVELNAKIKELKAGIAEQEEKILLLTQKDELRQSEMEVVNQALKYLHAQAKTTESMRKVIKKLEESQ